MKVGDCMRVQTKTLNDVFGVCYYEIEAMGLKAPEAGREEAMDGVKAVMLGGSGPAARQGMTIIDSEKRINEDIAAGIIEMMPREQAEKLLRATPKQTSKTVGDTPRPPTGVVEMD